MYLCVKEPGIVASDILSYCFCMNYDYYVLLKSSVVMEMVEMVRFISKILYYWQAKHLGLVVIWISVVLILVLIYRFLRTDTKGF